MCWHKKSWYLLFLFLLSFYKTRNPAFAFLISFTENSLSEKSAIVRKKHASVMDTRKVMQYEFLILL